jgi:hypothetical protein
MEIAKAGTLADFGRDGQVTVSLEDYEDLSGLPWRLDSYGYVVRSEGHGRVTLARVIAARAGMGTGIVKYRDGNPLNCTRPNLRTTANPPGVRTRAGGPGFAHGGLLHPPGVHRRPQTQDGPHSLPPGWVITFHAGPCEFPEGWRKNCSRRGDLDSVIIGTASRLGTKASEDRWSYAGPRGTKTGLSFFDGCLWLKDTYLESPADGDSGMAA